MGYSDKDKYDDIIDLPHPTSGKHRRMSLYDRAAQFSPFAALTGYDAAIKETERLTDERVELDEYTKAALDERINLLQENLDQLPEITITYFQPDKRKAGGAYCSITGCVKKIDLYEQYIVMQDKQKISLEEIVDLQGEIFRFMENRTI